MRIGLNLLYLLPGLVGGTETYGTCLMNALSALDGENEYFIFLNRQARHLTLPNADNFQRVVCPIAGLRRSARYAWEQLVLPQHSRKLDLSVLHSLGYVMPLYAPEPSVVTIPDLNFKAIPQHFPAAKKLLRAIPAYFCTQSARRAHAIITLSEFSKSEIVAGLSVKPEKVLVTHLGPRPGVSAAAPTPEAVRATYRLPTHYIVAFGGGSRHKNIDRLVAAFKGVKGYYPHSLVIIGHVPSNVDIAAEQHRPDMKDRILSLGYVPAENISPLLRAADLFVLPSLYEGFGLPILEAQQAGVAVLSSTAGSLPEVAGQGALYFDPLSVEGQTAAIRRCLDDSGLRERLRKLGTANLRRFDWSTTAQQTLDLYCRVATNRWRRAD